MHTRSAAQSDVGRKRQINEDSFHRDDALGFYVVADGVGGHSKGEVASQEAVEQLVMWVRGRRGELDPLCQRVATGDHEARWDIRRLLEAGIKSACYMVFGMAELDPEKRGMSTTMSCLLVAGGNCYAGHVGDSRVYRVRAREVLQVTEDHTLINYKLKQGLITAEEAQTMSGKNVITRAVGHKDYVQVDTADLDARAGDRFFLCTDGMHGYLDEPSEVAELVGDGPLEDGVAAAVALANTRGGKDNITVLAIEVLG
jgi:serine/threonine protein phosphatase PrpC